MKMGMIMDPSTVTTPEEMGRIAVEMVALRMLEPALALDGPVRGETYAPTKDFLDAFIAMRKRGLEDAKTDDEKDSATYFALAGTVRQILEMTQPCEDRAVMIMRQMNYYYAMAIYMMMAGLPRKLGFDELEMFPAPMKSRMMERMAR